VISLSLCEESSFILQTYIILAKKSFSLDTQSINQSINQTNDTLSCSLCEFLLPIVDWLVLFTNGPVTNPLVCLIGLVRQVSVMGPSIFQPQQHSHMSDARISPNIRNVMTELTSTAGTAVGRGTDGPVCEERHICHF